MSAAFECFAGELRGTWYQCWCHVMDLCIYEWINEAGELIRVCVVQFNTQFGIACYLIFSLI